MYYYCYFPIATVNNITTFREFKRCLSYYILSKSRERERNGGYERYNKRARISFVKLLFSNKVKYTWYLRENYTRITYYIYLYRNTLYTHLQHYITRDLLLFTRVLYKPIIRLVRIVFSLSYNVIMYIVYKHTENNNIRGDFFSTRQNALSRLYIYSFMVLKGKKTFVHILK